MNLRSAKQPMNVPSAAVWGPPPPDPRQANEHLHVWRALLDGAVDGMEDYTAILSDEERQRAAGYHFERDGRRFAVGRAILRDVLARYVDRPAAEIRLARQRLGKLRLAPGCGDGSLRFNLSHSGALLLIAITRNRRVGVDVEEIRPVSGLETLVERYFLEHERQAFGAAPTNRRLAVFFQAWTQREALLKARGVGLAHGLEPGDAASEGGGRWIVEALDAGPGFAAALAVEPSSAGPGPAALWDWVGGGQ